MYVLQVLFYGIQYQDSVFVLSYSNKVELPYHKFSTGDMVLLTHKKHESPYQGSVVEVASTFLRVAISMKTSKSISVSPKELVA